MSVDKKHSNNLIIGTIILSVITVLVLIVVWALTNSKETVISDDVDYGSISSLSCESSSAEGFFFKPYGAIRVNHRIVMTFIGQALNSASYSFLGTYNSDMKAESAEAWLHGAYNEHFKAAGINPESYSPNFSSVGSKVTISVYSERNKMNNIVMQVFNMDAETFSRINDLNADDLKKFYEGKGFTCTFHE